MLHFRLKTDKKLDGTRISPVQQVDYILHEGNFAEEKEWEAKNKFVGNFISSAEIKNACKNFNSLLRRLKKKKEIERRNFIANGGKIFTERTYSHPVNRTVKTRKLEEITERGIR